MVIAPIERLRQCIIRARKGGCLLTRCNQDCARKWIAIDRTKPSQESMLMDSAHAQINRYLDDHGRTLSSIIEVESGFAFDLNGQIVQGTIDLLKRDMEGGAEIVDFKASEMPASDDRIRRDDIDLQLDIYALGVENALGFKMLRQLARHSSNFFVTTSTRSTPKL
jgi:RecB family exonuclease